MGGPAKAVAMFRVPLSLQPLPSSLISLAPQSRGHFRALHSATAEHPKKNTSLRAAGEAIHISVVIFPQELILLQVKSLKFTQKTAFIHQILCNFQRFSFFPYQNSNKFPGKDSFFRPKQLFFDSFLKKLHRIWHITFIFYVIQ